MSIDSMSAYEFYAQPRRCHGQAGRWPQQAKAKAKTRKITVKVYIDGGPPLKLTFQAENMTKARQYAMNRWPHARKVEYVK